MFPGSNVVNSEFRFRNSELFSDFTAYYHKTSAFEVQFFQKFNSEIRTHKSELGRGKPPPDFSRMSSPHPFSSPPHPFSSPPHTFSSSPRRRGSAIILAGISMRLPSPPLRALMPPRNAPASSSPRLQKLYEFSALGPANRRI